jgi:hypothetical protein
VDENDGTLSDCDCTSLKGSGKSAQHCPEKMYTYNEQKSQTNQHLQKIIWDLLFILVTAEWGSSFACTQTHTFSSMNILSVKGLYHCAKFTKIGAVMWIYKEWRGVLFVYR